MQDTDWGFMQADPKISMETAIMHSNYDKAGITFKTALLSRKKCNDVVS